MQMETESRSSVARYAKVSIKQLLLVVSIDAIRLPRKPQLGCVGALAGILVTRQSFLVFLARGDATKDRHRVPLSYSAIS